MAEIDQVCPPASVENSVQIAKGILSLSRTLHLALKREYFEAIRDGSKAEEYRLCTPYWAKRLYSPFGSYDQIMLTLGYPARDDSTRRMLRPWKGYTIKTITHPHFGPGPVRVYAINVAP